MVPTNHRRKHASSSGRTVTVMSINIEGFSSVKGQLIGKLCSDSDCDILCLQETHRGQHQLRPKIPGMKLTVERPHEKYGSAIFTKPDTIIDRTSLTDNDDVEILSISMGNLSVTSVYKPPGTRFSFKEPKTFDYQQINVIIGDFNSHSTSWGYSKSNNDGILVEEWAEAHQLNLIHDAKLPPSFNSCRWRRGYNPDLVFTSERISALSKKNVLDPIPHSQHRPIVIDVTAAVVPQKVPLRRRFNFRKGNWESFTKELDEALTDLDPTPANYEKFIKLVQEISKKHIPRGCREYYIPGISADSATLYDEYLKMHDEDPFSDDTLHAGEVLMAAIAEERRKSWQELIEGVDMTHNSKKAWSTIKKINNDPKQGKVHSNITANQVAHQLLLNGKTQHKLQQKEHPPWNESHEDSTWTFTLTELQTAISSLKNGKAAGLDDIRTEQITHFGQVAQTWLLTLFNNCIYQSQLPKIWRKARVIAILKPGKDPQAAKSYRPISLLCHLYKLFERLVLNRLGPITEQHLIPEQAGFRPGRSCTGQVLNLTQFIEDGYERNQPTGVVFVDLTAAYDTVNHRLLLNKLYKMTHDIHLTKLVQLLLENRRFFVELNGQRSRWRIQRNGLPQGSVLAPVLFNIYTNDQPISPGTRSFIYADDLGIATQNSDIKEIEGTLTRALDSLTVYYQANQLKANPSKTQVSLFHLRNRESGKKLSLMWNGTPLDHCEHPVYLGVTLDRTLSFKQHIEKVKGKVRTRNNLLRKLANSSWGACASTLRATALALCYSAAEYACPVWERSSHSRKLDPILNDSCRAITGCLKATNIDSLYVLSGIAPPGIRRSVASSSERLRQSQDSRHPCYDVQPSQKRLKSRKSFLHTVQPLSDSPQMVRCRLWEERRSINHHHDKLSLPTKEQLPPGHKQDRLTWKSLNRLRTGMGRCKVNMRKWGYTENDNVNCDCGTPQTMQHLPQCPNLKEHCSQDDLMAANEKALKCAKFWPNI